MAYGKWNADLYDLNDLRGFFIKYNSKTTHSRQQKKIIPYYGNPKNQRSKMKFHSTNKSTLPVSFKEAVLKGQAPDKGLYFPESIPVLPGEFYNILPELSLPEIANTVMFPFVKEDIDADTLKELTSEVFDFDIPLIQLEKNIYALELFHGPTAAFKDIGARFMSKCLEKFSEGNKEITVLVATSGDTGSAVANGFLNVPGIKVVILYPDGKVSPLQEKQFTSLGENITAIAINGTFDDCQALVKKSFADDELNKSMQLSSANSINIARWLPQSVYYFYAVSQLMKAHNTKEIVLAVPSGNFGNLAAGLLGKKMGLPVKYFIAATNLNKIVPDYLSSGNYQPLPSVTTIANAMDVGDPSNFVRIMELYGHDFNSIAKDIKGYYCTDEQIRSAIATVFVISLLAACAGR
ncbi:MAG: threonine synthase, partial [Ferruginibacter sp.]